jgi:hypothetical protein
MDQLVGKEVHDCKHYREGVCSKVARHGLFYRVFIAILGTMPGLLLLIYTSKRGAASVDVASYVPEMFWAVVTVTSLAYLFIIWKAAYKRDRPSIEDYATTSAAMFSTIVASLPFLKEIAQ